MALVDMRLKTWWGEVEIHATDEDVYPAASVKAMGPTGEVPNTAARRLVVIFARTPAGSVEDRIQYSLDFVNYTGGNPDDSWITADFTALETLHDNFWTAIKTKQMPYVTLAEYRWYRLGPSIVPPNPAVRIATRAVPGTSGGGPMPPQVAMTVTEKTAVRREWGRFYLPTPDAGTVTAAGRITSTYITTVADAANTMYDGAAAADFLPVVYSPTRKKTYGVETLQVDDVFDVQRPRRWSGPLSRTTRTVGP